MGRLPVASRALEQLRGVLSDEGLDPDSVELVEIASDEQAQQERFFGSPTIRIDGEDVIPPAEGDPVGLSCRLYRLRDGRPHPLPNIGRPPRSGARRRAPMRLGDSAPDLTLPDTDGQDRIAAGGVTAVVFTCNHCPYALAWRTRIADVARDYAPCGVRCSQSPQRSDRYPADSFEAMKERVEREGRLAASLPPRRGPAGGARVRRAKTAPDVFVFDAEAVSATAARPTPTTAISQNAAWLRAALDAVLAGEGRAAETEPVGCSIGGSPESRPVAGAGVALGLAAGISWGISDFLGGLKSRSLALLTVLLLSQGAGLVLITAVVVAAHRRAGAGRRARVLRLRIGHGGRRRAGGVLPRGLAVGAMAVVAPISGTAAAIPVASLAA